MFDVIYLFVLVWAGLPLARTSIQGSGGNHVAFVHRLYRERVTSSSRAVIMTWRSTPSI
jgi:hypothetical protein